jgi:peptidyl-prolyl cis-trans isomerase SurA
LFSGTAKKRDGKKDRMTQRLEKHTQSNHMGFRVHTQAKVFGWMASGLAIAALGLGATASQAQQPAATPRYTNPAQYTAAPAPQQVQLPQLPVAPAITANGTVVEDVIARINDQIITRSTYEHSEQQMVQDAQQQNLPQAEVNERLRNLLRDMIDQQLLLSKGKELSVNCDAEVSRRLDDLRKQNHLDSMEALEKAAATQGVSFEDFKQGIANQCITQQVVRDEVGRHIQMTRSQEQAYYNAHTSDFLLPEQIHLSEILIPTPDNATDTQIANAQAQADDLSAKLKAGGNFAELAKSASGGPTASAGGDLGDFKRGTLGDVLEKATFSLPAGGVTPPIRTRQGFVLLRVDTHQAAGTPPLEQVEQQVQEAIYMDQLQPALRDYLTKARQDAYMDVAAGFVDTGSNAARQTTSTAKFTAYTPPPIKKHTLARQRAEQEKAAKAAAELAAARERVAEKQAAKTAAAAAQKSGVKNTSKVEKPKKIRREKIRYGQAPRNSLPVGLPSEATVGAPIEGQAPGVAMAPTQSTTSSISTGVPGETQEPELAAEAPTKKTRFSGRQQEQTAKVDENKLNKAMSKATDHPIAATPTEAANEKTQAAPLGLNGDTVKKQPKPKLKKGDPKNRLQEKPKPAAPAPVAPTVNPALGVGSGASPAPAAATPPATTPPATTPAPQPTPKQ